MQVTPLSITVANLGDSRAVLCTHPRQALPLSRDHKPDDREEAGSTLPRPPKKRKARDHKPGDRQDAD